MKAKLSFVCEVCGYDSPAFMGKCPECGTWNSLREIKTPTFQVKSSKLKVQSSGESLEPKRLSEIKFEEKDRFSTGFSEMDGVLGGGIVPGSVILLAGDPGIGKSTLLLQLALNISAGPVSLHPRPTSSRAPLAAGARRGSPALTTRSEPAVLYISGEESEQQIKLRANRLTDSASSLRAGTKNSSLLLLSISNTDAIVDVIANVMPKLVIIDSIQVMESENLTGLSGSVGQVRYAAGQFIKIAKSLNISIIIVGHVTKEGMVAGPMVLSHMVDTVLFLEGEKFTGVRVLRGLKNRFGPIDEVGVFSMEGQGMNEVKNPETLFLSQNKEGAAGSVLTATMEGTRAFLVEIQGLAVFSKFPMPRRVAAGIDYRRLELLLAVLQKHVRLPVDTMDIYVNVAGGLKLSDPGADLGICLAIFSSLKNIPVAKVVGIAEVGLLGELRPASDFAKRAKEAKKLGFTNIIGADKFRTLNQVIQSLSK
ncbi:MAG: DNA repair protein RadA [Candidatus Levybacteria bacterium]|nr:DNA repair protein RadA [Candidatus Levybacteria bacterium]